MEVTARFFSVAIAITLFLLVTTQDSILGQIAPKNNKVGSELEASAVPSETTVTKCPKWLVAINGNLYIYTAVTCQQVGSETKCSETDVLGEIFVTEGSSLTGCEFFSVSCRCKEQTNTIFGPFRNPIFTSPSQLTAGGAAPADEVMTGPIEVSSSDFLVFPTYSLNSKPRVDIARTEYIVVDKTPEPDQYYRLLTLTVTKNSATKLLDTKRIAIKLSDAPTGIFPQCTVQSIGNPPSYVVMYLAQDFKVVNQ